MSIATIGVFGWTLESFLAALHAANVRLVPFPALVGTMPHDKVMRAIELLGTEVAPIVREEVARRASSVAPMGQPT